MKISHEPTWIGARQKTFRKIKGDVTADVAIIGGGLTGLLTAYLLVKDGKKVAVLEARYVGFRRNGIYHRLRDTGDRYQFERSHKNGRPTKSEERMAGRTTCNNNNRKDSEKRKDRLRVPTMLRSRLRVE